MVNFINGGVCAAQGFQAAGQLKGEIQALNPAGGP